ncbi:MAG: transporter associated domain-containing protein [Polyangiales bacterium]
MVGEGQKIGELLRVMQAQRVHLAVVVDEFGSVRGILTLEDILEEIVGDIQDEHDEEEDAVFQLSPGHYVVNAGISLHDLEEILGEPMHTGKGAFESLGGMIVELAGRVPAVGESIQAGDFACLIRAGDERHIVRVEIVRRPQRDDAAQAPA